MAFDIIIQLGALMCLIFLFCVITIFVVFAFTPVDMGPTCIGVDSWYRGRSVRCTKKSVFGSNYCEEHQNQKLWGFKGDKKLLKYLISIILVIFLSPNFDSIVREISFELSFHPIFYILIYVGVIIFFIGLISPDKARYETHDEIDEAIKREAEAAKERAKRRAAEEAYAKSILFRKKRRYTTRIGGHSDGSDVGDFGSGLGDTMGADDDG